MPDIVLEPYEGSEPGDVASKIKPSTGHRHIWDFMPSPFGDPPKYEHCLLCKEKRRVTKPEVQTYIPTPHSARTGY